MRELLLGPQRFSDLRRALPNASSNLVADRLRELEGRRVINHDKVAGSWVYELTEWGRELEPIVLALGGWGGGAPQPPEPASLSATSVLLLLRNFAPQGSAVYRVELDDRVWTVLATAGQVVVRPGEPDTADASLRTDPLTLSALLADPTTLEDAVCDGDVVVEGDLAAVRRLLGDAARP